MSDDAEVERELDLPDSFGPGRHDTITESRPQAGEADHLQNPASGASFASLTGAKKAAVFILSLDEDVASLLLPCLSDAELGRITTEIAGCGVVDKDTVASVIREFRELERIHGLVCEGGVDQARRLIERSFPSEKAKRIIDLLTVHRHNYPFTFLEGLDSETLAACVVDEHPQTLAVVLAHMNPTKAAEILEKFPSTLCRDVLERIASLEGASTEALQSLELSLRKQLDGARFESLGDAGGVKAAAEILRAARGGGVSILDDLREDRPELAEEIKKHIFIFDDIATLDDRALQAVLKEIDTRRLALALKKTSEAVRTKVFNNLSRRAADMVREEMDFLGPVRFVEVEAARRAILETVLRMEASGDVFISSRGREEDRIVY